MRTVLPVLVSGILAVGLAPGRALAASQDPPAQAPVLAQEPPSTDYVFPSGAGLLFFYVRPEKRTEFESIVGRIGDVLNASEDPVRRAQAAHWHMFGSVEAVRDQAIYVFVFDPALPDADYDPVKLIGEGLPAEAQALYADLADAVVRVERMGLRRIR